MSFKREQVCFVFQFSVVNISVMRVRSRDCAVLGPSSLKEATATTVKTKNSPTISCLLDSRRGALQPFPMLSLTWLCLRRHVFMMDRQDLQLSL